MPRATWRSGARLLPAAALVVAGSLLQAAPLQDQGGPLPQRPASSAAGGGSTLDRALQVDTSGAQQGADLLQLGRTPSEPSANPSARRAPAMPLPSQAPVPVTAQMSAAPTEQVSRSGLQGEPGGGPGSSQSGDGRAGGAGHAATDLSAQPRSRADAGSPPGGGGLESRDLIPALRGPIRELVGFVRENRYWVFGALAVLVGAAAAVQAFGRHGHGERSAEARAQAAAAAQARANAAADRLNARQARRTRRRSSSSR